MLWRALGCWRATLPWVQGCCLPWWPSRESLLAWDALQRGCRACVSGGQRHPVPGPEAMSLPTCDSSGVCCVLLWALPSSSPLPSRLSPSPVVAGSCRPRLGGGWSPALPSGADCGCRAKRLAQALSPPGWGTPCWGSVSSKLQGGGLNGGGTLEVRAVTEQGCVPEGWGGPRVCA